MALDLSTVTVADFQAQFYRDFPYFDDIQYDPTDVYNTGDEVYYTASKLFWSALVDGVTNVAPGTDAAKWVKTADSIYNYVQDRDITNAFNEAQIAFNPALFSTDSDQKLGYLYLTAHFLCNDLKAAMGGINAAAGFPVSSRTVGSVSEGYSVPQWVLDSPIFSMYAQSSYGMKYLMLILPNLTGNVISVWGGTRA